MNRTDELLANELKAILDKNTAVMATSDGREINDNESMHLEADEILVEVLEDIGKLVMNKA